MKPRIRFDGILWTCFVPDENPRVYYARDPFVAYHLWKLWEASEC